MLAFRFFLLLSAFSSFVLCQDLSSDASTPDADSDANPLQSFADLENAKSVLDNFSAVKVLYEGENGANFNALMANKLVFKKEGITTSMTIEAVDPKTYNPNLRVPPNLKLAFKITPSSKPPTKLKLDYDKEIQALLDSPAKDPCERLGKASMYKDESFIPMSFVRECYLSFDYKQEIGEQAIKSLKSFLDFYVFKDFSARTINLDDIDTKPAAGKKDFTFQESLTRLIQTNYDGHLYYYPACYRFYSFYQPIYIASVVDTSNRTRLFVANFTYAEYYPKLFNPYILKNYGGWEVSKIDFGSGLNATGFCTAAYAQIYADLHTGKYRSTRTRYNSAFSRSYLQCDSIQYLRGDLLATNILPNVDYVTYRFLHKNGTESEDIQLPWVSTINTDAELYNFTDKASYWDQNCSPLTDFTFNPPSPLPAASAFDEFEDYLEVSDNYECKPDLPMDVIPLHGDDLFENIYFSNEFSFYGHIATKTAVLHMKTFAINNERDWLSGLSEGFDKLKNGTYKKLILDLSENDGGNSCLASMFVLFIEAVIQESIPDFDLNESSSEYTALRYSDRLVAYSKQTSDPNNVLSQSRYTFKDADGSFEKHQSFNRTFTLPNSQPFSKQGEFVTGVTVDCPLHPKLVRSINFRIPKDNFMVATNTICGSACAVVLNAISRLNIAVVAVSTSTMSTNPAMSIQSFAGGQRLTSDDIMTATSALNPPTESFASYAYLSFTLRGIGLMQGTDFRMLEFALWPASYELQIGPEIALRPKLIWDTICTKAFTLRDENPAYTKFRADPNPARSLFNAFDKPEFICFIDNILSFLLSWDGGNFW